MDMQEGILAIIAMRDAAINDLANRLFVKPKHIANQVNAATHYRPSRKGNLFNALVSKKGKELNFGKVFFSMKALHISQTSLILGLEEGNRHSLKDIQGHVREDMQDGTLTQEYEDEALKELEEGRNLGNVGTRTTTTGLGVDARYTTSRIGEEVHCSVLYHILCLPLFP
jgi:hypothetical protein